MSTHRLSVSGDRPFVLNAGGGSFQAFSANAKMSDGVHADLGGQEFLVVLPARNIKLERYELGDGHVVQVLRIKGEEREQGDQKWVDGTTLTIHSAGEEAIGGHPRTNLDVRKATPIKDRLASILGRDKEPVETIDLAIPPTE